MLNTNDNINIYDRSRLRQSLRLFINAKAGTIHFPQEHGIPIQLNNPTFFLQFGHAILIKYMKFIFGMQ